LIHLQFQKLQFQKEKRVNKRFNIFANKKPVVELKKDQLSLIIYKLLYEYKALDFKQLKELVEIYNGTHLYVKRYFIEDQIIKSLNTLEFEFQVIYFDSKLFCWKLISDSDSILCEIKENRLCKQIDFNPDTYKFLALGVGDEFVYCLFSPRQKIESIVNKNRNYPIKVGKTNNIVRRIKELSVSGTEALAIDAIFRTKKSAEMEKFIHRSLENQFSQIKIPGRKEWFYSNKVEVLKIHSEFSKHEVYF
jgi:hypothetical protein